MMPPPEKRKASDIASQMQPKRLSMGNTLVSPTASSPDRELELELIQPHMAQKPVLRGEVGRACVAREVSAERGGMGERGCARRLGGWVWV